MYGYSEDREIALYTKAVAQLDSLITLKDTLRTTLNKQPDESNTDKPPALFQHSAALLVAIRSIRNTLAIDGSTWESRPYDLLTIQSGDDAVNSETVASSKPFERAHNWEKLLAFFYFEDQFRRFIDARAEKTRRNDKAEKKKKRDEYLPDALDSLTSDDLSKFLKEALASLDQALARLASVPSYRKKYDIFDNAISYTERIARWQEYKVSKDDHVICIPDSFCEKYKTIKSSKEYPMTVPYFSELLMFTTMFFKHLQRIGITEEKLKDQDYWHIPGGMKGLGAYQRNSTAETFFTRVQKSIDFFDICKTKPPIRMIALNGEWMANMDAGVFKAFSDAHAAHQEPNPNADECAVENTDENKAASACGNGNTDENKAASACGNGSAPFSSYLAALFPKPVFTEIRKYEGFFALESDGSLAPAYTLSKKYSSSKSVFKPTPAVCQMILDHQWGKKTEEEWTEFWAMAENYLRTAAAEMLEQKREKKSIDLKWMKYASTPGKRSSQLILGYLCTLKEQPLQFDIQMKTDNARLDAFCKTANTYLENDSAECFNAYYNNISNEQLKAVLILTVKEKCESVYSVTIKYECKPVEEKKPAIPNLASVLDEFNQLLLNDFFRNNLENRTPEELNGLFSFSWDLWKEHSPKFAVDPGSQLLSEKTTLQENLWSFCEAVLLWYSTRDTITSKTCKVPEKPFENPDHVKAFSLFCKHLSYQWFGWKLNDIKSETVPVQFTLSKRTKTPGLCENDDDACSFVQEPCGQIPDASLLDSVLVKGFRCLLHRSFFTKDREVCYAPRKKSGTTQEFRNLYFLGSSLLYFGLESGSHTYSWDFENNVFIVDDKKLSFSEDPEHSAKGFATYLGQDQFVNSNKAYSLSCTHLEEKSNEFSLSIEDSSVRQKKKR